MHMLSWYGMHHYVVLRPTGCASVARHAQYHCAPSGATWHWFRWCCCASLASLARWHTTLHCVHACWRSHGLAWQAPRACLQCSLRSLAAHGHRMLAHAHALARGAKARAAPLPLVLAHSMSPARARTTPRSALPPSPGLRSTLASSSVTPRGLASGIASLVHVPLARASARSCGLASRC